MQNSKLYLKKNNILPTISFKDGRQHQVKLIQDKEDEINDDMGKPKAGVRYKVMEGGEVKTFFTASPGLIQKLAEYPEETEVIIQMKSKKAATGYISFFEVSKVGENLDNSIPVIEDGNF